MKLSVCLAALSIAFISPAYATEDGDADTRSEVIENGSKIPKIKGFVANLKKIEKEGDVETKYVSAVLDKSCKLVLTLDVSNKTKDYLVAQEVALQGVRYVFLNNFIKKGPTSYPDGFIFEMEISNQTLGRKEEEEHGDGIVGPNDSERMQFEVKNLMSDNCEIIRGDGETVKGTEEIRGFVVFRSAELKGKSINFLGSVSGHFVGNLVVR